MFYIQDLKAVIYILPFRNYNQIQKL